MENQPPSAPGTAPSQAPAAVTAYGEDTPECQQAAQAAALIQYGRATAPRAMDKPSTAHIDLSWMSDDELDR
ncbi:hypothetical protein [Nonomuraea ceibae]|uniref:hypothetical protein n=1 Tax=Nonomuraea ceibae TaxID=1935170 RepID=UPI001C5DD208|nr:hypothetical protein [Nonomuraea ceibae]